MRALKHGRSSNTLCGTGYASRMHTMLMTSARHPVTIRRRRLWPVFVPQPLSLRPHWICTTPLKALAGRRKTFPIASSLKSPLAGAISQPHLPILKVLIFWVNIFMLFYGEHDIGLKKLESCEKNTSLVLCEVEFQTRTETDKSKLLGVLTHAQMRVDVVLS